MEGNELSRLEALRAVEHELDPDDRAKLELVNYVAALDFIAESSGEGTITYTSEYLKRLHGIVTKGLGREDSRFKPHHEGEWRDGTVAVQDGMYVYHLAPDPEEVDELMAERMAYLEQNRGNPEYPTPVLAGVAHFEIGEVHPFADYNGRAARLFATAVFHREGLLSRPLFSPEKYYAEDKPAYLEALRAIKRTTNLEAWLEYFTTGLAQEFERVAERVRQLAVLTQTLKLPVQLSRAQEQIIALLTTGRRNVTISEVAEAVGVSVTTASRELNRLVSVGVLRASGLTRDRTFRLAAATPSSGGRPRIWSDERIERELREFSETLGYWPSYRDFQQAGSLPLYTAMQRSGGADRWRARVMQSA
jgi:Fic family protein